ncbi:hypothetical protein GGD38_003889 [Chitinophagaceae bacterium OAS944]|nr:hypothetical protein [Chitinophagaceae bacterium OAS944]
MLASPLLSTGRAFDDSIVINIFDIFYTGAEQQRRCFCMRLLYREYTLGKLLFKERPLLF